MNFCLKKIFFITGFITFAIASAGAQNEEDSVKGGEKIKVLEIGYLTTRLSLSGKEAETFWPVFNQYRAELRGVVRSREITNSLDRQQKILDIRKRYSGSFSQILDEKRGEQVFEAEDEFKLMIRREMQQRRKMRQNGVNPKSRQK